MYYKRNNGHGFVDIQDYRRPEARKGTYDEKYVSDSIEVLICYLQFVSFIFLYLPFIFHTFEFDLLESLFAIIKCFGDTNKTFVFFHIQMYATMI